MAYNLYCTCTNFNNANACNYIILFYELLLTHSNNSRHKIQSIFAEQARNRIYKRKEREGHILFMHVGASVSVSVGACVCVCVCAGVQIPS